jgi:hypothetical protein
MKLVRFLLPMMLLSSLALLAMMLPQLAAAFDLLGIGTAVGKVADASWKIIAIQAIVAQRWCVMLICVVYGMTVCMDRTEKMMGVVDADGNVTKFEGGYAGFYLGMVVVFSVFLVLLGYKVIIELFK